MATGKLLTGLRELDELLGGLEAGELIVIAGRPSTGKTALVAAIVAGVGLRKSRVVFVASPEMSAAAMARRISASRDGIRLGAGRRMRDRADDAALGQMHVDDDQTLTADAIAVRASGGFRRGAVAVVVDPVWCLGGGRGRSNADASSGTAAAIRSLRAAGGELGVPVIATVGLTRHAGTRPPRVTDMHASVAIRAEADTVLLLHSRGLGTRSLTVTLAKHPGGRGGTTRLSAASRQTR